MALNYAQVWSPDLLEIMEQESLISPFITTAVKFGEKFYPELLKELKKQRSLYSWSISL